MTQFRGWIRFLFAAGSISPLIFFEGVAQLRHDTHFAIPLMVAGLVAFGLPLAIPLISRVAARTPLELSKTALATPNLLSLLAGVLLPFVGLDVTNPLEVAALAFLLLIFAVVSTRSSLIYLQPAFFLFGWHVYECEKRSGEKCWVLCRETLVPGSVSARDLGKHVWID